MEEAGILLQLLVVDVASVRVHLWEAWTPSSGARAPPRGLALATKGQAAPSTAQSCLLLSATEAGRCPRPGPEGEVGDPSFGTPLWCRHPSSTQTHEGLRGSGGLTVGFSWDEEELESPCREQERGQQAAHRCPPAAPSGPAQGGHRDEVVGSGT